MPREVEGLDNLNRILTLPARRKIGMFVYNRMDEFRVSSYLDRIAKSSGDRSNKGSLRERPQRTDSRDTMGA